MIRATLTEIPRNVNAPAPATNASRRDGSCRDPLSCVEPMAVKTVTGTAAPNASMASVVIRTVITHASPPAMSTPTTGWSSRRLALIPTPAAIAKTPVASVNESAICSKWPLSPTFWIMNATIRPGVNRTTSESIGATMNCREYPATA